ncbi:nucleotide-binding universal stress UspA family protein [Nakamurella sp. UYEF19]|uniref:universal stress protein n=1 Tax=Nakamurella sp. UYEF19 TaxID=1756392 RepID=UPI0033914DB6
MATAFERGTDGPRVIVVAVDGSTTSMRAAFYAAGLARRQSAELVVVFVVEGSTMANLVPSAGPAVDQAQHEVAAELRQQIKDGTTRTGARARFLETKGDPYQEISKAAKAVMADAVIVGASMSAGHRLVGSLGVRLVRAGLWPVTVVP